ncbi:TNF receptor-associated factor 3-like [Ornithodoros turicata]|uniref:TNF receptor-associated factor 3-like n=1 Tax=Ornithodoros turicata TaxID=34597 RepID=UPI003139695E
MPRPAILAGFASSVYYKPFDFVDDIPEARFCQLCGVLPMAIHMLECTHGFCQVCYAALPQKALWCPLDRYDSDPANVKTYVLSENKLLQYDVRCWNSGDGCLFVGNYRAMMAHFFAYCFQHSVNCPRCDSKVLQKEMLQHYKGECRGPPAQRRLLPHDRFSWGAAPHIVPHV